jgi:REP-associated tyrosine transposase
LGTYTRILYQIVFQTKHWEPTLAKQNRERLFAFISGILIKKDCFVLKVGGVEDHIHIITHVHPNIAVSQLVKDIKLSATAFIRKENLFPNFNGWNAGFGAITYSLEAESNLIKYVINQEVHHKKETSREEYLRQLKEFEIDFNEKYI